MRASRAGSILALLVGILLIIQGLLGIVAPQLFVDVIRVFQEEPMIYVAAALRLAIGVVLICAASGSRIPMFLRVFGSIIVIGGLLTPFVGAQFAHMILALWSTRGIGLVRIFAVVSLALGVVTAYAILPARRNA